MSWPADRIHGDRSTVSRSLAKNITCYRAGCGPYDCGYRPLRRAAKPPAAMFLLLARNPRLSSIHACISSSWSGILPADAMPGSGGLYEAEDKFPGRCEPRAGRHGRAGSL